MRQRLGLAAAAIAATLACLVGLELGLRALGVGAGGPARDPLAGFSSAIPHFALRTRPDGVRVWGWTDESRLDHAHDPSPREFLADKPAGSVRVFVVGGSSAAGVPYGAGYAFSSWAERRLRADAPDVRWEVVNAARSGYATQRILKVVGEIARHEPDVLVIYCGHNEFAERRFYTRLVERESGWFRLRELIAGTRLYALASRLRSATSSDRPPAATLDDRDVNREMFAVIGQRAGGEAYPTAREIDEVELLYRRNLQEMVRSMRAIGARVVLVTLGQNLADWPPGASRQRADLPAAAQQAWRREVEAGDAARTAGDCARALAAYRRALAIDETPAALHYRIAGCERGLGRLASAREHYRRASDLDAVPLGAPSRLNGILHELASELGADLVEGEAVLERAARDGLIGDELFVDFVHPNLRAQQLLGEAVAPAIRAAAGIPAAQPTSSARTLEPTPASLYASQPELAVQEHLMRALSCILAQRRDCALAEAAAVPDDSPHRASAGELSRMAGGLPPGDPAGALPPPPQTPAAPRAPDP